MNKSQQGSGLIITMIFVVLAGVVTSSLMSAAVNQRKLAQHQVLRERAFSVAEGAIEFAAQTIRNNAGIATNPSVGTGTIDGYSYGYIIQQIGSYVYRIDATGVVNGIARAVRVNRVEIPSWAKYALWMKQNNGIYFIGGESFYGHVHSDEKLWFTETSGDGPDFYDRCTSLTNSFGGTTNLSTFAEGLELNSEQGSMVSVDFNDLLDTARTAVGGLALTGITYITFTGSNMKVRNTLRGWTNQTVALTTNSIVYIKDGGGTNTGIAYIGGRLDGRLTVVAENDIRITNHVRYAVDPRTTNVCNDALGLVAKDDITVWDNAPDDLEVFAAMLASGQVTNNAGSWGVNNHDNGDPRGALTVWGSIVQESRGAVGQFNSSGITHGYYKNYGYDSRFLTDAPPYYPRVDTRVDFYGWTEGPG